VFAVRKAVAALLVGAGRFDRLSDLSDSSFTNESEYFADSEICFIFVSDFKELKLLDALQS